VGISETVEPPPALGRRGARPGRRATALSAERVLAPEVRAEARGAAERLEPTAAPEACKARVRAEGRGTDRARARDGPSVRPAGSAERARGAIDETFDERNLEARSRAHGARRAGPDREEDIALAHESAADGATILDRGRAVSSVRAAEAASSLPEDILEVWLRIHRAPIVV